LLNETKVGITSSTVSPDRSTAAVSSENSGRFLKASFAALRRQMTASAIHKKINPTIPTKLPHLPIHSSKLIYKPLSSTKEKMMSNDKQPDSVSRPVQKSGK
jgi:hypothetical protein